MKKNIKCLVLFGSHARGDHDLSSDIDLLGIDNSYDYGAISNGKTNFSLYSEKKIKQMMSEGDLFALHIKEEGICIYNNNLFENIKSHFTYKESYIKDIFTSYFLAKKILERENEIKDWKFANRRITWCIRTFIISLSAEKKSPVFSKSAMSKFTSDMIGSNISAEEIYYLIDSKSHEEKNRNIIKNLELFLECFNKYDNEHSFSKKEFYSSGVVCNTLDNLFHDLKKHYI